MMRPLLFAVLLCLPLAADTVVVGGNDGPGGADGFPFGTNGQVSTGYYDTGAPFQEIYSASTFPGLVTITGISFASASGQGGSAGTFTNVLSLGLGTAATGAASPDATYTANQGSDFSNVFSGPATASLSETDNFDLSFTLTTPFTYNPANGDLLLQVTLGSPVLYTGTELYFDAGNSTSVSEVFDPSPSTSGNIFYGFGLLTQFTYDSSTSAPAAAPEPTTYALLLLGALSLLAGITRKKA